MIDHTDNDVGQAPYTAITKCLWCRRQFTGTSDNNEYDAFALAAAARRKHEVICADWHTIRDRVMRGPHD